MKVIILGASGMVGQGALRECLRDSQVTEVLCVGRSALVQNHAKLRQLTLPDLSELSAIEAQLAGCDACFFCLGVSSAGMNEARYRTLTYDLTLAVARPLARLNPAMTFIYVSGVGTDSSEQGRSMWARVKGATENALLALPFHAVMFRPGAIVPLHGIRSRTRLYDLLYRLFKPLWFGALRLFPQQVTTTERVGLAMLAVAHHETALRIIEPAEINRLALPSAG
ncbi:Putative NADH-flavin reductase [Serratia quinivorans]|uniref:NAD-dependent epimerase/dehydratase family protein n=1 Tax=Serratia quinivorans TaxID=137545 RepID=UPI00217723DB|nr:NAD-dependent epimerase/dehydratase family protein [Serratia quinivorans]CAI1542283.1 Putative NADH-flavin reductase [Serratia quinivorans]CAI1737080.1 Putative NADH-flavin reductase [Serratia quinivorans]